MKILVTGAAGFIGYHLCRRLLEQGHDVVALDNFTPYYDVTLKHARVAAIPKDRFTFEELDIADPQALRSFFERHRPHRVAHLAAQAGVRYSLTHPEAYVSANLNGFMNILECSRHLGVQHLVYASSSSVYGLNRKVPFSVEDPANHPISIYAATKRANELMAHSYSHLFGLPATGLRFFTVYGPWGRPDMALFTFTRNILEGKPIDVFNHGRHRRDFTYVDDIIEGVSRVIDRPATPDSAWNAEKPFPATSSAPHVLYNIGNNSPVWLSDVIESLEKLLGRKAQKNMLPMQPGDVLETYADVSSLERDLGYKPKTSIQTGLEHFVRWYRDYYSV